MSGSSRSTAGAPRALTAGDVRDSSPQFRRRPRPLPARRQVWAVPLAGGEPEQLTALPHGVARSRRARRHAAGAAPRPPRRRASPSARRRRRAKPLARVITRVDWRLDGAGYLDRHAHLWVAACARRRAAAAPDAGDWSVEGVLVAGRAAHRVLRRPGPRRGLRAPRPPCTSCRRRGGGRSSRAWRAPAAAGWSPDGEHVAFLGIDEAGEPFGCEHSLWVVPAGRGATRSRSRPPPVIGLTHGSDLIDWEVGAGGGRRDGPTAVMSPVTSAGHTALWRFPLAGEPGPLAGCEPHIHGSALGGGASSRCARRAPGPSSSISSGRPAGPGGSPATARRGSARCRASRASASGSRGRRGRSARRSPRPRGAGREPLPLVLSIIGGPGGTGGPSPGSRTSRSPPRVRAS